MSDATCERCQSIYAVRDGMDPTRFCDACTHEVVDKLKEQIIAVKFQRDQLLYEVDTLQCDLASMFDWDTHGKTFIECVRDLKTEVARLQRYERATIEEMARTIRCLLAYMEIQNPFGESVAYRQAFDLLTSFGLHSGEQPKAIVASILKEPKT